MNEKIKVWGGYIGFYLLIIIVAIMINARFDFLNKIDTSSKEKIVACSHN